jgi:hypothetical protein
MLVMYGAGLEGPLDDIWKLNVETWEWTLLQTKGTKPSNRVIRSVGFLESKQRLYVFGGGLHDNLPVMDNNMYCFDIGS